MNLPAAPTFNYGRDILGQSLPSDSAVSTFLLMAESVMLMKLLM